MVYFTEEVKIRFYIYILSVSKDFDKIQIYSASLVWIFYSKSLWQWFIHDIRVMLVIVHCEVWCTSDKTMTNIILK